jgi:hypothetical protein
MHEIIMFFKITFLTKSFSTIVALKSLDSRVKADMVFDIARFVECLATAVYQTLNAQVKFKCFGVKDARNTIEFFWNTFESMRFNIQIFLVHQLL